MWHYQACGHGRPLILLHGIGMSHAAWRPVLPALAQVRHVIAFDAPGFGLTPPLSDGMLPTASNLASDLIESLSSLGLDMPVDIAGNSMGGTMALEVAKRGRARSVVAISPAGLWQRGISPNVRYVFQGLRSIVRMMPAIARAALRHEAMRELLLSTPLSPGSGTMPEEDAIRVLEDLINARAFETTFSSFEAFSGGQDIRIPLTIAFGQADRILPPAAQRRELLPVHTRWLSPEAWGHVPMWVDPEGVSRLILQGTSQA